MPSCRCGEISVVNGKIDLLEREGEKINFYYAAIPARFTSLRTDLEGLANACSAAFESEAKPITWQQFRRLRATLI